jgi:Phage tail assembly chaperone protein
MKLLYDNTSKRFISCVSDSVPEAPNIDYVYTDQELTWLTDDYIYDDTTKSWTYSPSITYDQSIIDQYAFVKRLRNKKLAETDWTQMPDIPSDMREAWAAYRQALRDVPEQTDPFEIEWPAPPK